MFESLTIELELVLELDFWGWGGFDFADQVLHGWLYLAAELDLCSKRLPWKAFWLPLKPSASTTRSH
jgi:hypothetical protein